MNNEKKINSIRDLQEYISSLEAQGVDVDNEGIQIGIDEIQCLMRVRRAWYDEEVGLVVEEE